MVLVRGFAGGKGVLLIGFWPEDAGCDPCIMGEYWGRDEEDDRRSVDLVLDLLGLRDPPDRARRSGFDPADPLDFAALFDNGAWSRVVLRAVPVASVDGLDPGEAGWTNAVLELERLVAVWGGSVSTAIEIPVGRGSRPSPSTGSTRGRARG